MESISAVVAMQTSYPILSVERQTWGGVRVKTGVMIGPRNSGGRIYFLKRSGSTWKVKKAVNWRN